MTDRADAHEAFEVVSDDGETMMVVPAEALASFRDLEAAAREYELCADWYRRCLEGVQDGQVIRGLAEAKAAFDVTRDNLLDGLAALDRVRG
jgi:hypothetical protein